MKRTTVKIPDGLDARLRHEAARRGSTISELTREALEVFLGDAHPGTRSPGDAQPGTRSPGDDQPGRRGAREGRPGRRLRAAAAGRSGRSDVAERIEEILATEVER